MRARRVFPPRACVSSTCPRRKSPAQEEEGQEGQVRRRQAQEGPAQGQEPRRHCARSSGSACLGAVQSDGRALAARSAESTRCQVADVEARSRIGFVNGGSEPCGFASSSRPGRGARWGCPHAPRQLRRLPGRSSPRRLRRRVRTLAPRDSVFHKTDMLRNRIRERLKSRKERFRSEGMSPNRKRSRQLH